MPIDFRLALQNNQPIKTITTIGNTNYISVLIPESCKRITVGNRTTNLFISFSYEEGDAKSTIDNLWIPGGELFSTTIPIDCPDFQLVSESGTASNTVCIFEG